MLTLNQYNITSIGLTKNWLNSNGPCLDVLTINGAASNEVFFAL